MYPLKTKFSQFTPTFAVEVNGGIEFKYNEESTIIHLSNKREAMHSTEKFSSKSLKNFCSNVSFRKR